MQKGASAQRQSAHNAQQSADHDQRQMPGGVPGIRISAGTSGPAPPRQDPQQPTTANPHCQPRNGVGRPGVRLPPHRQQHSTLWRYMGPQGITRMSGGRGGAGLAPTLLQRTKGDAALSGLSSRHGWQKFGFTRV